MAWATPPTAIHRGDANNDDTFDTVNARLLGRLSEEEQREFWEIAIHLCPTWALAGELTHKYGARALLPRVRCCLLATRLVTWSRAAPTFAS